LVVGNSSFIYLPCKAGEGKNPFDTSTKLSAGYAPFDPFDYTQGRLAPFDYLRAGRTRRSAQGRLSLYD